MLRLRSALCEIVQTVWRAAGSFGAWLSSRFLGFVCDLAGFVGCALVAFGVRLIYLPAGYIVAGFLLTVGAVLYGRQLEAKRK